MILDYGREKRGLNIYILGGQLKGINERYSPDEIIVAGLVLSIFISIYTTVAVMIVIICYLIWQNQFIGIIDSVGGIQYLVAFFVLTVLVSVANANFAGILAAVVLAMVFITAAYARQVMTRILFNKIIDIGIAASLFSFAVAVLQHINRSANENPRVISTFLNPNYYAAITEVIILFCIYKLLKPNAGQRPYLVLALLCNLYGLYLSDCRTACLALGAGFLLLLFLNRRFRIFSWCAAGLGLLAMVTLLNPNMIPRSGTMGVDLANRMSIWSTALRGILNHPAFGQGFGTYQMIYPRFSGPYAAHAHNLLLEPLLNFGLLGTLLLALYLRVNLHVIRRLGNSRHDRQIAWLVYAILCCVVVHGITDITFFNIQSGLLLILALASGGIVEHPAPAPARLRRAPALVLDSKRISPRNRSL